MVGLGLGDLPRPPDRYNPALNSRFESRAECMRLDRAAARALIRASTLPPLSSNREEILELAQELDYASRGELPPATRASRLLSGDLRMRVGGAQWELIERTVNAGKAVSFVTLCPRGGDVLPEDIGEFDPVAFGRELRADIDRIILSKALCKTGWSILYLDSEYQLIEGVFRFHWHGFASGAELKAIDLLRQTRKYVSPVAKVEQSRDPVRTRVRVTRKPLYDVGYLSTYPTKPEWRGRRVASNQDRNRDRSFKTRLSEPYRTMERLFFDRHSIRDITVVRGLRVTRQGLVETRRNCAPIERPVSG